ESILEGRPHHAIALDASGGQRSGTLDLACMLAQLAVLGFPVRLSAWDENPPEPPPKPTTPSLIVPICGANYVRPRKPRPPAIRRPVPSQESPMPEQPKPAAKAERGITVAPVESPSALTAALRFTQESLAAFQKMQEQTAQIHRQFLEHQNTAQETLRQ